MLIGIVSVLIALAPCRGLRARHSAFRLHSTSVAIRSGTHPTAIAVPATCTYGQTGKLDCSSEYVGATGRGGAPIDVSGRGSLVVAEVLLDRPICDHPHTSANSLHHHGCEDNPSDVALHEATIHARRAIYHLDLAEKEDLASSLDQHEIQGAASAAELLQTSGEMQVQSHLLASAQARARARARTRMRALAQSLEGIASGTKALLPGADQIITPIGEAAMKPMTD